MLITFIVIFIIMALFLPVPLKIRVSYDNKKIYINFFNIDILNKFTSNQKKFKLESNRSKKNLSYTIKKIKSIIRYLLNSKSKFRINIKINIYYGLDDAADTAILYGVLHSLTPILFIFISKLFKIGKKNINITPYFNKNYFKIEITSIIYISFAKIIYIIIFLSVENLASKKSTPSKI
ncbi:DUF2953 domain-containing protein [Clostridium sp. LBM24168]